ncbi:hypothetical protein FH039_02770 [Thermococcus indicus]|uniref:Uncharacterized protein n=1 Tax=Thermococcus indicus TaxID=2586643 RepID=A0A4Y5SIT6_9EURY|nr:DUF257 family protein [Thermococcus indicus]QDA30747.1 hypothetical protein FH039_02770 [Thermococcus indicus]
MGAMEWEKALEIADSVLPGETVLVRYTTSYIPEFLLRFFVDYAAERDVPLLIDDNFDALHTILVHAKFMNLTINIDRDNVYVLKTGGRFEVGNVIAKVPFHPDPRVYLQNYEKTSFITFQKFPSPAINLVLGLENLLLHVRNPLDTYRIILGMQKFVGNKKRKAFYIVNEGVLENLPIKVMGELERISTTVIKLTPYHTGANLKVLKTINPALLERETKIDTGGWD